MYWRWSSLILLSLEGEELMKRISMEGYGLTANEGNNKRLSSLWMLIHSPEMKPSR